MTLTGLKKHVQVLEDAMEWIALYQCLWERRLDGLEAYFTLKKGTDK